MKRFGLAEASGDLRRNPIPGRSLCAVPQGIDRLRVPPFRFALASLVLIVSTLCHAADRVLLPVEIMGSNGTTVSKTVMVRDETSRSIRSLWLQVHGLRFAQQASVQVNAGPWIPLSNETVTVAEPARTFGGIGSFGTVSMTIPLPGGTVMRGPNRISFRFNQTDGIVSGFRVLAFNLVADDGRKVLPPEDFVEDAPDSWTPPRTDAASIQAGKRLWQDASLLASGIPGSPRILARCADCHARDGRDLKYFNFSNESIIARSRFHGLSTHESEQIASYIRTLPVPNPGRPWNPPYQPGPGVEDKPAPNWSAGAGLSWVLEHDLDSLPYLLRQAGAGNPAPDQAQQPEKLRKLAGEIPADLFRPDGNLNAHLIPIALELPDWNQWLPIVHPKDAWGAVFTRSDFATFYADNNAAEDTRAGRKSLRAILESARSSGRDVHSLPALLAQWSKARQSLFKRLSRQEWTPERSRKLYSTQQWQMVKTWEIMQEFDLEGSGRELFGPGSDDRTWISSIAAETAPAEAHIPDGPNGIGGSALSNEYLNSAWYSLQVVLNSGNHQHRDRSPVDWVYLIGHFQQLYSATHAAEPARLLVAVIKAMQSTDPQLGPEDMSRGWRPEQSIDPRIMVSSAWDPQFRPLPPELRSALTSAMLTAWIDKTQRYTIAEYLPLGMSHFYIPPRNYADFTGGYVWQAEQEFRDAGVSNELLERVRKFGAAYIDRAARIHYE